MIQKVGENAGNLTNVLDDRFNVRERSVSSDKSDSAISLKIKRSNDRGPHQSQERSESNKISLNIQNFQETEEQPLEIPVTPQEATPERESESDLRLTIPISVENTPENPPQEPELDEDNRISINFLPEEVTPETSEPPIQIHETEDP